jgi:hypothetical protein
MGLPAQRRDLHQPDDEAIPVAIPEDAGSDPRETGPIPDRVRTDEITLPFQASLDSILEHELLRQQSQDGDDGDDGDDYTGIF